MKTFNSTVLLSAGYNQETLELVVTFQTGKVYVYSNVPLNVWKGFDNAKSEGRYFNNHIRNIFPNRRLV